MANPVAGPEVPLNLWNCVNCRRRKIRCDRRSPCSHCSKGSLECAFPVSGRVPTRRYHPGSSTSSKEKQVELLGRLRHLESLVDELSTQHGGKATGDSDPLTADHSENLATRGLRRSRQSDVNGALGEVTPELGRVVATKSGSQYIGNCFWAALSDEVCSRLNSLARRANRHGYHCWPLTTKQGKAHSTNC